jgi:hypothetical protein
MYSLWINQSNLLANTGKLKMGIRIGLATPVFKIPQTSSASRHNRTTLKSSE